MIYGIGTDICSIERIAQLLQSKLANRFVKRILTDEEINIFSQLKEGRKVEYLAGRFAIKEAVSKALGTGIGSTVGFLDMNIQNNEQGKPLCQLSTMCYSKLRKSEQQLKIHITLSHEKQFAVAFVVIESN